MSDGVFVTLVYNLKPEAVEPFCTRIPGMLDDTRKFKGFRDIKVVRHAEDPNQVIFIEEWDSAADYQAYIDWRRETGVSAKAEEMLAAPRKLDIWKERVA